MKLKKSCRVKTKHCKAKHHTIGVFVECGVCDVFKLPIMLCFSKELTKQQRGSFNFFQIGKN
jgi:hypothetical protein